MIFFDTNGLASSFQVASIMKKASTLKIAAQLRDLTSYCAVRENDTRWSSTFLMVKRFLSIEKELSQVVDLLSLLPNHLEIALLKESFQLMQKFDSVTIMLQREGMSFVESREIFDLFLKDYPEFAHYISQDALIVENELFEKAVMRVARGLSISEDQEALLAPLLKEDSKENEAPTEESRDERDNEVSYSEELQRKLKRQRMEHYEAEKPKLYVDMNVMPGTSVNCERLFSTAKFILSDTRKRTSPKLFEALILLKVNKKYWNALSVGKAMGTTCEEEDNNSVVITEEELLDIQNDCRD